MSGTLKDGLSEQFLGGNSSLSSSALQHLQATLKQSHKSTTGVQRAFASEEELRARHERPHDHLGRDPNVRTYPFADELRGQFGTQERNAVQSIGRVEIIRVQPDVVQEVFRVCLGDAPAREI